MGKHLLRALVEMGFIIFLFYSNLLMSDYTRSGLGRAKGIVWALEDVFTPENFAIAVMAALVGYLAFEFLRRKL